MAETLKAIIGIMVVGAAYLGLLVLLAKKLGKGDAKKPEYGSKYSEDLAISNGFRHGSLSD